MAKNGSRRIWFEDLRSFCQQAYVKAGVPEEEAFKENLDQYIKSIKESGKARDVDEILMPGEPEFMTESEHLKEGIPLASNTVDELISLGQSLGISIGFM